MTSPYASSLLAKSNALQKLKARLRHVAQLRGTSGDGVLGQPASPRSQPPRARTHIRTRAGLRLPRDLRVCAKGQRCNSPSGAARLHAAIVLAAQGDDGSAARRDGLLAAPRILRAAVVQSRLGASRGEGGCQGGGGGGGPSTVRRRMPSRRERGSERRAACRTRSVQFHQSALSSRR